MMGRERELRSLDKLETVVEWVTEKKGPKCGPEKSVWRPHKNEMKENMKETKQHNVQTFIWNMMCEKQRWKKQKKTESEREKVREGRKTVLKRPWNNDDNDSVQNPPTPQREKADERSWLRKENIKQEWNKKLEERRERKNKENKWLILCD